jgi:hypothetical protein
MRICLAEYQTERTCQLFPDTVRSGLKISLDRELSLFGPIEHLVPSRGIRLVTEPVTSLCMHSQCSGMIDSLSILVWHSGL